MHISCRCHYFYVLDYSVVSWFKLYVNDFTIFTNFYDLRLTHLSLWVSINLGAFPHPIWLVVADIERLFFDHFSTQPFFVKSFFFILFYQIVILLFLFLMLRAVSTYLCIRIIISLHNALVSVSYVKLGIYAFKFNQNMRIYLQSFYFKFDNYLAKYEKVWFSLICKIVFKNTQTFIWWKN